LVGFWNHGQNLEFGSLGNATRALGGDLNPWDLTLSDSVVLAGYRAGPYRQYFPVGAIVARSRDGHVFSFAGHDSTITTMFMAASEDLQRWAHP
jgi:hypothetical protein